MDKERKKRIIIGFISLVFLWVAFSFLRQPSQMNGYQLSILFPNATGLQIKAEVRLSGVKIGEVLEKEINADYQAIVEVSILSHIKIPTDSIAFIQTDGLFGSKYIQIALGGSDEFLENGDEFEYTQGSADIEGLAREIIRRIRK
ncbi:MAG: MlaD family protein [Alphaproteobacteria bacterium]